MRLFHLVEEDHLIGPPPHRLSQHAAFLIADIARRGADKPRDRVLLHELRHVDSDHRAVVVEQEARERLGELGLADAGRAEEQERAHRPVRILQARAGTADGAADRRDRLPLADDPLAERLLHMEQLFALAFEHLVHRDARPARDDRRDVLGGDLLAQHRALARRLSVGQLLLQTRYDAIAQLASAGEVAASLRLVKLEASLVELLLELGLGLDLLPLRLPALCKFRRLLLKLREIMLEVRQAIPGCGIRLLSERFPLDLQLDDAPVKRLDLFRLGFDLHADPACRLIHQVDRLVGQEPVGDVAVGERRRRDDRPIRDPHAVVQLVLFLETPEDGDRVLHRRLADEHWLEPALERRVFLDILTVFVERGRADTVQLAAGKRGLQEVARIHRAFRLTCADQRVHLVYEEDDVALGPLHFVEHALETLLELAAIFRAGDERPHVERHQLAILERVGNVAIGDAERQPFHDRGLTNAGIADEHGIVLGPTRQNLNRASDLLVPADHRIELPVPRGLGEVAGEFLQRIVAILGACRVRGAPAAKLVDRFVQRLGLHARSRQSLASRRACREGERQQ